jgi:hypothetical protein
MPSLLRTIAAVAVLAAAMGSARGDEPIGANAAVNPHGFGTPPAGTTQPLAIGQPVVFNERIATEQAGQTQILFRDQSALSVGPGSDLVIDQFVYDPNAGTGKLAMSATRGVFRFVGGRLSKLDNPVTLKTPSATLGIRGGIFVARVAANGGLTAVFVYGKELTVTAANGAATAIRRPGFAVSIDRPGGRPSAPFAVPHALLDALLGQFDGPPGNRLGTALSDARVAAQPLFTRLTQGSPVAPQSRPETGDTDERGMVRSRLDIDDRDLRLNTIGAQGDRRLLRFIQEIRQP